MIKIDEFEVLPFDKKCDFITVFADYLANRSANGFKYYLYHINGFFVEVTYVPSSKKVARIWAFRNIDFLSAYLEKVDIEELCL